MGSRFECHCFFGGNWVNTYIRVYLQICRTELKTLEFFIHIDTDIYRYIYLYLYMYLIYIDIYICTLKIQEKRYLSAGGDNLMTVTLQETASRGHAYHAIIHTTALMHCMVSNLFKLKFQIGKCFSFYED